MKGGLIVIEAAIREGDLRRMHICFDSVVALTDSSNMTAGSNLILKYRNTLNSLAMERSVELLRISEHNAISGNEDANNLATYTG